MANKYYVFDLSDNIMEEFGNKTDADAYITTLLSENDEEDTIYVIYGEELKFDVKAFIKKEN